MDEFDLLNGNQAIAAFTGFSARQVQTLVDNGTLPSFKLGRRRCARRSTLTAWLAEQEAASRAPIDPDRR